MKATILTASYNSALFITECIQSVLFQDYKNWEMVIVDDCSEDDSCKIIRKICSQDSRIRLISSGERLHCGGAYFTATEEAKGNICCVLDSDDTLNGCQAISKLVKKYKENEDVGYIWTNFCFSNGMLKKLRKGWSHLPETSFLEAGIKKTKDRHAFSHWRTFRTELREKTTIFKAGLPAAVDKWMSYALEEVAIGGFYDKKLYNYRSTFTGLTYKGRKHWEKFKKKFYDNRVKKNIIPYPTKRV